MESASRPTGSCSPGCWDGQALVPAFSSLEPHLSHQLEQDQTCHITSTPGESIVSPIPGVGAWGWSLVTECENRA